jgi:hypothetical protein
MKYTIYDPDTGEITGVVSISDSSALTANLHGKCYVEGEHNGREYYVLNQQLVEKPIDPSSSLLPHTFDYVSKTWQIDLDRAIFLNRMQRDQLLSIIDKINPVWYNSLTNEQQQELVQYRQALLAVPQQHGFPITVNWPAKPTWL